MAPLDKGEGRAFTLFCFTQGGWEGLSDKMAPAVVKEEAGRYLRGWGRTEFQVGSMKSRGRSSLGLFQAERGWNRMCARVCGVGVGWGVGAWGQLRTQRWVRGSGGNSEFLQELGNFY